MDFSAALITAAKYGLMAKDQYIHIARLICANRPCNVLVFGMGYDVDLWHTAAEGNVIFVENDPSFVSFCPITPEMYIFQTKVGQWCDVPKVVKNIAKPWDFI